jgi:cyclopropane fatty-acyl-phospholipid synthase-like methyltransferase
MTTDWVDYDQHARTRPRDDLWGQVRRTVAGQPVAADQIDMIVLAIRQHLALDGGDVLLDLACGNGALSERLFPFCRALLGVDISEYLVGIASERFQTEDHQFVHADAADWAESAPGPERYDKVLCYGSFAYFSDEAAARLFAALGARFSRVSRVMLGNLPDPARAQAFYGARPIPSLDEPRSDIGVWRDVPRLRALAGPGWEVEASLMPENFFARHYRFDAVLRRRP